MLNRKKLNTESGKILKKHTKNKNKILQYIASSIDNYKTTVLKRKKKHTIKIKTYGTSQALTRICQFMKPHL